MNLHLLSRSRSTWRKSGSCMQRCIYCDCFAHLIPEFQLIIQKIDNFLGYFLFLNWSCYGIIFFSGTFLIYQGTTYRLRKVEYKEYCYLEQQRWDFCRYSVSAFCVSYSKKKKKRQLILDLRMENQIAFNVKMIH